MEVRKIYFIDIVYYCAFSFYRRFEKDLNEFSGQALTSVCLSLNVILLIILSEQFFDLEWLGNKWYSLFVTIPILLMVVIRYSKFLNIIEIEDALYQMELLKRKRVKILAITYIVLSIVVSLLVAIILGEVNNPPPFWSKW
ncbi:MAG: hypothetical protein IR153_00115 [Flavobacterium sp.]|nr:hypothetical protein [Flavobacterium sp.]